jgi:hypothetical protein
LRQTHQRRRKRRSNSTQYFISRGPGDRSFFIVLNSI